MQSSLCLPLGPPFLRPPSHTSPAKLVLLLPEHPELILTSGPLPGKSFANAWQILIRSISAQCYLLREAFLEPPCSPTKALLYPALATFCHVTLFS